MRVRELLAANAFCLLAISVAGCERFEQTVGEYRLDEEGAFRPNDEPRRPPETPPASGPDTPATADAGLTTTPVIDEPSISGPNSMMSNGAAGARSSFSLPPPTLLDAGTQAPDGGTAPTTCAFKLAPAERRRLDMYLMIDNNSTLPASGAWEDVRVGLEQFVRDNRSTGIGVGVRYFGLGCTVADYAKPDVRVDVLPQNADRIIDSTTFRRWTASPMLPALQGAIQHQQVRANMNPQRKQIVVLISDALAQDFTCRYTPADVTESARRGLIDSGVETHVIAVGVTTSIFPLDELIARVGAYSDIAEAGGSGKALVTSVDDDGSELRDRLKEVRQKASPCEFRAPAGVHDDNFSAAFYPEAAQLQRYTNARTCGAQDGWYYDESTAPHPVRLCPRTCEALRADDEHQIWLMVPTDCQNP